ncbi:MAG: VOC family protein [Pseudonocardiaceae bacterium]
MDEISVRYIVDDVDVAVDFYTTHLGFDVRLRPGPGFAMLQRGGASPAASRRGHHRQGR